MTNEIDITVVVPLFNEEESLPELYEQLAAVTSMLPWPFEFLFIDDGSTDRSGEIITALHEKDKRVRLIQFRKNYGKSAAFAMGFREARGQIIITIDADLQDDPGEIPNLLAKMDEGYDLVSGWKKERFDPFIKRNTSLLFNWATRSLTGLDIHDINCGLKAYRVEAARGIKIYGQLHRFVPVLVKWQGFRVGEIPVKHHERKYGKTKFGSSRFIVGFLDLITVLFITRYTKRPLHLFGTLGLLSFSLGCVLNVYLAYERLFLQKYLTNRPLLFLGILLIIVGVQFISMGLLGEMIAQHGKRDGDYSIKKRLG